MDEIVSYIKEYVEREYDIPAGRDILEFDFLDEGYVDSISFFAFMAEIEDRYNIEISDEELSNRQLSTIGGLANFIRKRIDN